MSNFEVNRETKTLLGSREYKKTNFRFGGNKPIYFRGKREQVISLNGLKYGLKTVRKKLGLALSFRHVTTFTKS